MPGETVAPAAPLRALGRTGQATRERILTVASELFYDRGIRATSADRIIERAGITKVTFYRHFPTKSDLVVAYLGVLGGAERLALEALHRPGDSETSLRAIAAAIGENSCRPGFRGCAFINAAAEFSDPADPARVAVGVHRDWMQGFFASLAAEAGVRDADAVGRQLMVLRDGAMVDGYLGDPDALTAPLSQAFVAVLGAAKRS